MNLSEKIQQNFLHQFVLQMADNTTILGHRLGEICGRGPILEQDIAMTNLALDLIGHSRMYYQYLADHYENTTQDSLPYLRSEREFVNLLIVEMEDIDFAYTIVRSFFFDHYYIQLLSIMKDLGIDRLSNMAAQALKEVSYHRKFSTQWILRLGDGTTESIQRLQSAIDDLYPYTGEMFVLSPCEKLMEANYDFSYSDIQQKWKYEIDTILAQTNVQLPENVYFHRGGKLGIHSEKLGFILADMQYLQRSHPQCQW